MPHRFSSLFFFLTVLTAGATAVSGQTAQISDGILSTLASHQYDVGVDGRDFLLKEAGRNDFFLLGELHGENEIPALLRALWPQMWKNGYRHIAAEVSPWTAHQLEGVSPRTGSGVHSLWTRRQARDVHSLAGTGVDALWGCDMEEFDPQLLIRDWAALNPGDADLSRMVQLTLDGYDRKLVPDLLALATSSKAKRDVVVNDISLRENLLATLRIDKNRSGGAGTKMTAQTERELLMKRQLLTHLKQGSARTTSKVLLRFGRNHLHRGYDARGISTLGNFTAEYALAHGQSAFNVGAFASGGRETLMGETFDADERSDELTFALLAEIARYSSSVFDLRPLRELLHRIPQDKRSALEINLTYWADSYDALICYRSVTPLANVDEQ